MERKSCLIFLIILSSFLSLYGQKKPALELDFAQIEKMGIKDHLNKKCSFQNFDKNTLCIFVFLAEDCPISQKYIPVLNQINRQYDSVGLKMYGVIPGNYSSNKTLKKFVKTYQINFPALRDETFQLTGLLDAKITPEVFLIDKAGSLIYKGLIDDWYVALGKHRTNAKKQYLKEAIGAYLKGEKLETEATEAIGCEIQRKK